jgi:2,4-dienoyl-CoA reductase-like NADH-dependent reductase (Old Yellow Enzyme family)
MPHLFDPLKIGPLELENRIVVAPMCQHSADEGCATDWHRIHLGILALSGAGLLITEATSVSPVGRISPDDLGLYSDANEAALARVLGTIRSYSNMPVATQLAHAGRKGSSASPWKGGHQILPDAPRGYQTVAPSAVPHAESEHAPVALNDTGLTRIRDCFAKAAARAARLGFDGIEIHMAHGYLLHQFLSPIANKRGAAAIHVSSGGVSPRQRIALGPGYQVQFAAQIKAATGLPTIAVGLITEAEQAEEIITSGKADAVALARAMLYDPRWPWHAAAELGAQITAPPQYWRSQPRELKDLFKSASHGQR